MKRSGHVHWNPPRIAIVLYQKDEVLLFHENARPFWHFVSARFDAEHSTVETAARHAMLERFAADIRPVRILAAQADFSLSHDDDRALVTIFLLAEAVSDIRDTRPGEQLRSYNQHGLQQLEDKKQLASGVLPVWNSCQAVVYDEQRPAHRRHRK